MNPIEVTVSVENIAPENGQGVAPIWFSLHDGSFDFFDEGKPASAAIEVMAEDGITGDPQDRIPPDFLTDFIAAGANPALFPSPENTIAGQFASSSAGQNGGYQDLVFFDRRQDPYFGVQLPGETASTTFVLNADPNQNRFFSYAGMLFPTNDGFIGNDSPQAIELFDAAGNFIGADFIVYGRDVWDSGTEVNDEDPTNVPYDLENGFNSVDENGVVSRHPGLNPAGTGGIVDFEFNGDRIAENADFSAPGYQIARIRIQAVDSSPDAPIFGTAGDDIFDAADSGDDFNGNGNILFAGEGNDLVDASLATDGGNQIFAGAGNDEVFAGMGDHLSGGTGDDILDASAGLGNNRLYGGEDNDELFAGESDRLFAGDGDDILDATTGSSNNRLYGQDGKDTFFLGSSDRLLGGDGDDAFFVTDGSDNLITGGAGADAFWIATGELITTANTITDFELDADVIGVAGLGTTDLDDLEVNQVGNDTVISFAGFDLATLLNTQASALQNSGTFVFI